MLREIYGLELHICECGNDVFVLAGHCTKRSMLYDEGMQLICTKCNVAYNAKTGEKVESCK